MSLTVPGALLLALAPFRQEPSPDLAPGAGRTLVLDACTGCHGTELIVASRMSRKNWDTTLTWMEQTQGLSPLEPSLRKAILDYLETTQGLAGEKDEGATGPWAYPRYRPNPIW